MVKTIKYDKGMDEIVVTLYIPKTMKGEYSYGEGEWTMPAVCVHIDEDRYEFALYHTQYLDYKDSLQATSPIFHFDDREEAEAVAKDFGLSVFYG